MNLIFFFSNPLRHFLVVEPVSLITSIISIVVSIGAAAVSWFLRPTQPKERKDPKPEGKEPTAEAGKPIPVGWGSFVIEDANILRVSKKSKYESDVKND